MTRIYFDRRLAADNFDVDTETIRARDAVLPDEIARRHRLFCIYVLLSATMFWQSMRGLLHAALHFDFCSQILVMPFVTILLIYWNRTQIFRAVQTGYVVGGMMVLIGLVIYWLGRHDDFRLGSYDSLSLATLGMVLTWAGGFWLLYGRAVFRAAVYPLSLLLLAIPIPSYILDKSVFYLQSGSTAIARQLFEMCGVPVIRQGFMLTLPGLTIEVAKECSSIRSSIALVITCLLAGYVFLRSASKRAALVLVALPLSIFKNGVRIVTLSLLSVYINPAFMKSDLHRDGGILFYLLALAIIFPLFRWFERTDRRDLLARTSGR